MSESVELKPCPFCGAAATDAHAAGSAWFIGAQHAQDCHFADFRRSEAEAVEAWNRRVAPSPSEHVGLGSSGAESARTGSLPVLTAEAVSPALPEVTYAQPIRYGEWLIYRNDFTAHPDWRSVAWLYAHEDYDGPEDSRHGFGPTVEACITDIQERGA